MAKRRDPRSRSGTTTTWHLPGGLVFERDASSPPELPGCFAAEARALSGRFDGPAGAVRLAELPLEAFHGARALAFRLGWVREEPVPVRCTNCDRVRDVALCSTLEVGPFRDGELDHPELDSAFAFHEPHELAFDHRTAVVRLAPRTVGDLAPLYARRSLDSELDWDRALVEVLGIRALDDLTDAADIARRLREAPELADALLDLWESAHYPPRLEAAHRCDCGAVQWLPVPALREFSEPASPTVPETPAGFPGPAGLEALAHKLSRRHLARLPASLRVQVIVQAGPADLDEAGNPLLGSYSRSELDGELHEVRLYYRTFLNQWLEQGPYDVAAEVDETVRHELEHLVGSLVQDDPLDDEERADLAEEWESRVGRTEARRRRWWRLPVDFLGFLRATWPLWLLLVAASWYLLGR